MFRPVEWRYLVLDQYQSWNMTSMTKSWNLITVKKKCEIPKPKPTIPSSIPTSPRDSRINTNLTNIRQVCWYFSVFNGLLIFQWYWRLQPRSLVGIAFVFGEGYPSTSSVWRSAGVRSRIHLMSELVRIIFIFYEFLSIIIY